MEPTLAVIGINFRTSPVAVREHFWISESRRFEALHHLVRAEGVDEVIVLPTCNRTEFILWTSDAPTAANSVLRFLTQEYQLKLCEWSHFYRLLDDVALTHVFRVASSLDSMAMGESEIVARVQDAWQVAQGAGCTGRFLDAIIQKALSVSRRVRSETLVGTSRISIPCASVELARSVLGDLGGSEVLVIGAGKMSELAAGYLMSAGAMRLKVMNRTASRGEELARKLDAKPVAFEERLQHLASADIVVSSTSCPHYVISRQDAESAARVRHNRPLVVIDVAVPRDIDPAVRDIEGIHLFDMDDLEHVVRRRAAQHVSLAQAAEQIIAEEVQGFRRKLSTERIVPTIAAVRARLEDLCREELEILRGEFGPFTEDQDQAMLALSSHIAQRIASAVARELKGSPEKDENEMLGSALHRLFDLKQPEMAPAGTKN